MSVAPPPTPNPAGNLASYLDAVSDANFSAINAFGSFLGTLADIGGAIALIEFARERVQSQSTRPIPGAEAYCVVPGSSIFSGGPVVAW